MLDLDSGNILHVDFDFMFNNSPGRVSFENAPFKLTREMIDVMGGYHSDLFQYFQNLLFQGLLALREVSN